MPWPTKKKFDDADRIFLKEDSVEMVQIIDDEPEIYYVHFDESTKKTSRCEGQACDLCLRGIKAQEKGSIKVVDQKDMKEKKLCGTAALFLAMKEVLDLCGGSKGFVFNIKATGQKSSRRYTIVPIVLQAAQKPETEDKVPF